MELQSQYKATVNIVIGDTQLRREIEMRVIQTGREALTFETGESFLDFVQPIAPNQRCMITEFNLPQMNGLAVLRRLSKTKILLPTLFYVDNPSIPDAVHAVQEGAVDVVERRPGHEQLMQGIEQALHIYSEHFPVEVRRRDVLVQLGTLNGGEHQVLDGILRGMMNKEIARSLKLSIRTIEQRRRQVFRKLRAQHPAELAQRVIDATHVPIDHTIKDHGDPLRSNFLPTA